MPPRISGIFSRAKATAPAITPILWAEVLDADGFGAFTEAKDPFAPALAKKLHDHIYSSGGTRDFTEAYRSFRGRDPEIEALLKGRGLETN